MERSSTFLLGAMLATIAATAPATQFGVNTKFGQGLMTVAKLDLIAAAGVSVNRDEIGWGSVEPERDRLVWSPTNRTVYDALRQHGIKTDVILSTRNRNYESGHFPTSSAAIGAFARYAAFVARQLKGHSVAYEIGNEWKPSAGLTRPVTMVDYVNLFVAAADAIHAVDPAAKVVADPAIFGGLPAGPLPDPSSVVGAAARRGLRVADGVVVHQYPYQRADLSFAEAQRAMVAAMTRRAAWLRNLAGRPVALYVTEYGWPQIAARGLTPAAQAKQIAETTRLLATMEFVRLAIVYELADSCAVRTNVECTFGLYERCPGGVFYAKPALSAFRSAAGGGE